MIVTARANDLRRESQRRKYFVRLEILDQTLNVIKARLYISPDLFVQVYRNDLYQTTNFVLLRDGNRLHARDEVNGRWHKHTRVAPDKYDDEVAAILAELNLL